MSGIENQTSPGEESKNEITDYYEGVKKMEMQGYESGIRNARTALFVTAALLFVGELISAAVSDVQTSPLFWVILVIQSGIFIALAFWTKTKPYAAVIVGLVVFILIWGLAILAAGFRGAIGGIIVKIIIIVYLVKAIGPAKAWEEARKNS